MSENERVIKTLNDLSYIIPEGYFIAQDKYKLANGQGFFNRENYFGENGVISLFEVQRDPEEFFDSYYSLMTSLTEKNSDYCLHAAHNLKANNFVFPIYVIRAVKQDFFTIQAFVNCGKNVGCFMITTSNWDENDWQSNLTDNKLMADLVKLLRTIK